MVQENSTIFTDPKNVNDISRFAGNTKKVGLFVGQFEIPGPRDVQIN